MTFNQSPNHKSLEHKPQTNESLNRSSPNSTGQMFIFHKNGDDYVKNPPVELHLPIERLTQLDDPSPQRYYRNSYFMYRKNKAKMYRTNKMKTNDKEVASNWGDESEDVKEYFQFLAEKGKLKEKERK